MICIKNQAYTISHPTKDAVSEWFSCQEKSARLPIISKSKDDFDPIFPSCVDYIVQPLKALGTVIEDPLTRVPNLSRMLVKTCKHVDEQANYLVVGQIRLENACQLRAIDRIKTLVGSRLSAPGLG